MGRVTIINPDLFPVGLRGIVQLPTNATLDLYQEYFDKLELGELKMCLKIMMKEYPGRLMDRKSRIRAEINRRERNLKNVGFEKAVLPRLYHWNEDFPRIWEETCEPIRRAINESRNKKLRNGIIGNNHSRRY